MAATASAAVYPLMGAGGPNNQYLQLVETATIAKALGRALVLAPFARWTLDSGSEMVKAFESTFDPQSLATFVPVLHVSKMRDSAPLEQLEQGCESRATFACFRRFVLNHDEDRRPFLCSEVIVHAGHAPSRGVIRTLCLMGRLRCATSPVFVALNLSAPACSHATRANGDFVRCVFKRAAATLPRKTFPNVIGVYSWQKLTRYWGTDDLLLPGTLRLMRSLRRAPHIRRLAHAAATAAFGQRARYLCVHLRRLENNQRCPHTNGHHARSKQVSCLPPSPRVLTTSDVANVIKRMLGSLRNVSHVYLARAIVSDGGRLRPWYFADEGETLVRTVRGLTTLSELGSMQAMLARAGVNAQALQSIDNYTVSVIEQQLCSTADAFIGTEDSTWTMMVLHERYARAAGRPPAAHRPPSRVGSEGLLGSLQVVPTEARRRPLSCSTTFASLSLGERGTRGKAQRSDAAQLHYEKLLSMPADAAWSGCRQQR